jgi:hypothetical protein
MARQHFCRVEYDNGNVHEFYEFLLEELEAFTKLVAAKERKAIIQIIKKTPFSNWFPDAVIEAIRKRGKQA